MKSRFLFTHKSVRLVLLLVWLASVLSAAPAIYVMHTETTVFYNNASSVMTIFCADLAISDRARLSFAIYQFCQFVILPFIVMVFCYSHVIVVLWTSTHNLAKMTATRRSRDGHGQSNSTGRHLSKRLVNGTVTRSKGCSDETPRKPVRREESMDETQTRALQESRKQVEKYICNPVCCLRCSQVIKMLLAIVAVFLFCWGPKLVLLILQRLRLELVFSETGFHLNIIFDCLPYIQSCANPIIYGFMSSNFRRNLKAICSRMGCNCNTKCPHVRCHCSCNCCKMTVMIESRDRILELPTSVNVASGQVARHAQTSDYSLRSESTIVTDTAH